MAWEQPLFNLSFPAATNLSTSQFTAVCVSTDMKVARCSSIVNCIGILQNNPTSGMEANVMMIGVSKVKFGAACARGSGKINGAATTYGGFVVTGTTTAGKGYHVQVIEAGAQANDIGTAIINFKAF